MKVEPQQQHAWLQRLVGAWTYETSAEMGPDQSPAKATGTETVRSLGGVWIVGEGAGTMPGGAPATWIITLGYDPAKARFLGTWIGSMMTHMWIYDGSLDASGNVLTLAAEGPSMKDDGTTALYHDAVAFSGDDQRSLTASVRRDDGTWHAFMTTHYRRTG